MKLLSIVNCELKNHFGAAYSPMVFADGLLQRGHQIELVGIESYLPKKIFLNKKKVGQIKHAFYYLRAVLKRFSFDLDIIEIWGGQGWMATIFLKIFLKIFFWKKKPIIVHRTNGLESHCYDILKRITGFGDLMGRSGFIFRLNAFKNKLLFSYSIKFSDFLITLSEPDKVYTFENHLLPIENIATIFPPLPAPYLGIPYNEAIKENLICFSGSWIQRKGIAKLVVVMNEFLLEHKNYKFLIIGSEPNFDKCRIFDPNVVNRVECIPFKNNRDELIGILKKCKIFYFPTYFEGYGLSTAEAMACGCVVVTSQTGLGSALKHGSNGMIIDLPNIKEQIATLDTLVSNEILRERIAEAGREYIQSFTLDKQCNLLVATYESWLEAKSK